MSFPINGIIKCESASVRLSSGEIFEFPVVDNKDLFPNFFRTTDKFGLELQCLFLESEIYAMYKRKDNIAYLICAWEKPEEINQEAMNEIIADPKLSYLLN